MIKYRNDVERILNQCFETLFIFEDDLFFEFALTDINVYARHFLRFSLVIKNSVRAAKDPMHASVGPKNSEFNRKLFSFPDAIFNCPASWLCILWMNKRKPILQCSLKRIFLQAVQRFLDFRPRNFICFKIPYISSHRACCECKVELVAGFC